MKMIIRSFIRKPAYLLAIGFPFYFSMCIIDQLRKK